MNRISLNPQDSALIRRTAAINKQESKLMDWVTHAEPKVWVVQEGNNDYAPAEKYGEVRFITRADLRSVAASSVNEQAVADVAKFLEEYRPEIDYIVPVGNPMMIIYVSMLVHKMSPEHRYLKWDGRQADYIVFKITDEGVVQ